MGNCSRCPCPLSTWRAPWLEVTDAEMTKQKLLANAVHAHAPWSRRGMLERLFTFAFKGMVYPQIWEDPCVDIAALRIRADSRIVTIASGGCNVMSYLLEDPERIDAVDLNPAHVALLRLKLAAAQHLPDEETFFSFFGHANDARNIAAYDTYLRPQLDETTRKHWDSRTMLGQRRIRLFQRNFYRFGLLGRFIGLVHALALMHGRNPRQILTARTEAEMRWLFDHTIGSLFDKKLVRALCNSPVSLYGLGIPPAQYDALASEANNNMAGLIRDRLERLACGFDIKDNYFAWQAFGRGYDREHRQAVPPYLKPSTFPTLQDRAERVHAQLESVTVFLRNQPDASRDRYILLDAQDWMTSVQLTELWSEITRTARPGARVIFRTGASDSPLLGAVPDQILGRWRYHDAESRAYLEQDRSSIYGGFHLYSLNG